MQSKPNIVAVNVPGEGSYCPSCFQAHPMEDVDALIQAVVHLSTRVESSPELVNKRKIHFSNAGLQGIRSLWTHNGLNQMEERTLRDLGMLAYDPRFPAQPMTPTETLLWQLVCDECPHDGKGWLPPGEAVLIEGNDPNPRLAGTLMACRACKTWQARILECVACGRILV